jgi:hypoxanthine phosphoribosyltransferase
MSPATDTSGIKGQESCSWFEIHHLVNKIAQQVKAKQRTYDCILGVANGGIIPAKLLAEELNMDAIQLIPIRKKQIVMDDMPKLDKKKSYLVVDDIYDTGDTFKILSQSLKEYKCDYAFCMSRYRHDIGTSGMILNHNRWIIFPWESDSYKQVTKF